jgi:hypothetical protein
MPWSRKGMFGLLFVRRPELLFGIADPFLKNRLNVIGQRPIFPLCALACLRQQLRIKPDGDGPLHFAAL